MTAAIEVAGLRKNYGSHVALRGIDLHVEPGEVYGFIGPNGAGKTTTMRILLDILRPTAGDVRVLGERPRTGGAALRARIGYLPGELRLDGRYDVATLLDHYARLSSLAGRPASAWRPLADRLGLDVSRQVRGLSKGNKQKVGLVQAFQHRPELLILDEPTSGLDPLVQAEFLALVREASAAGQTVFLSSHVLSEIEQAADRVTVLRHGEVVLNSRVSDLRASLGLRVSVLLAGQVSAEEFAGIPGVRRAQAQPEPLDGLAESAACTGTRATGTPASETRATGTRLTVTLEGSAAGGIDAVVKAAARHTVLDLDAERPDLEEAVMRLDQGDSADPDLPTGDRSDRAGHGASAPDVPVEPAHDVPMEATR